MAFIFNILLKQLVRKILSRTLPQSPPGASAGKQLRYEINFRFCFFSAIMAERPNENPDRGNGPKLSGSCSFQSGDMCGYTTKSTNELLGWDLIPTENMEGYSKFLKELQSNVYQGKVHFNPLDPTDLPSNMRYFPRISPNSLKISQ